MKDSSIAQILKWTSGGLALTALTLSLVDCTKMTPANPGAQPGVPQYQSQSQATTNLGAAGTLNTDVAVLTAISNDIAAQPAATQPYLRYFTFEAWSNLGNGTAPLAVAPSATPSGDQNIGVTVFTPAPPETAVIIQSALIKMLNLLSTAVNIVQPTAVTGGGGFIYRVDMRQLNWTANAWSNIKATDPYFNPANFSAVLATAANQTARADWFITNIPNSVINSYFIFLGLNSDDMTIDALNGVTRFQDMDQGAPATVRALLNVSETETFNRMITWHASTCLGTQAKGNGCYHFRSYNAASDTGVDDFFANPYQPKLNNPNPNGPYANLYFDYDDSDQIFELPNGLNGYITSESQNSLYQGQVQTAANTGAGFPGPTFCYQCHDSQQNMIYFQDQMNAALSSAPVGTFPSLLMPQLLGMFSQSAIQTIQVAASASYGAAIAKLNMPYTDGKGVTGETLNIVTNNYASVLTTQMAALELGVTTAALTAAIVKSDALYLPLSSMLTTDANGNVNGIVRRDTWEANYPAVRAALVAGTTP